MHESSYQEMKQFVERYLNPERELTILDIGSLDVNGTYKPLFNNPNWAYWWLDLVSGPNVDVVSKDPYRYPLDSNSFDVIISGSVVEHVMDMNAFMQEAARVLKPTGIMCIIAPWTYPEHKYPDDCWRIMPDGMRYLLETVSGLPVINVHKNETDCVGIAGMNQRVKKASFGVLCNDFARLDMVLRQSYIDPAIKCHTIKCPTKATSGLNKLLDIIEAEGSEIAILAHQDMFFRQGWIEQVQAQLNALPESWIVAGIIGKDVNGLIKGRFWDTRIPLKFDYDPLPCEASCFDECCIIVNMKTGFRFDEGLDGFDLYGTMCVLQAQEMGGTAWIIDAFAEHYCMRSFSWFPGKDFEESFKWLHKRFPNAKRIDSTVIGTTRGENKARYDDEAAA